MSAHELALVSALEAAERALADAERIIQGDQRPGNWVGSVVLARVRETLDVVRGEEPAE